MINMKYRSIPEGSQLGRGFVCICGLITSSGFKTWPTKFSPFDRPYRWAREPTDLTSNQRREILMALLCLRFGAGERKMIWNGCRIGRGEGHGCMRWKFQCISRFLVKFHQLRRFVSSLGDFPERYFVEKERMMFSSWMLSEWGTSPSLIPFIMVGRHGANSLAFAMSDWSNQTQRPDQRYQGAVQKAMN